MTTRILTLASAANEAVIEYRTIIDAKPNHLAVAHQAGGRLAAAVDALTGAILNELNGDN